MIGLKNNSSRSGRGGIRRKYNQSERARHRGEKFIVSEPSQNELAKQSIVALPSRPEPVARSRTMHHMAVQQAPRFVHLLIIQPPQTVESEVRGSVRPGGGAKTHEKAHCLGYPPGSTLKPFSPKSTANPTLKSTPTYTPNPLES